MRDVQVLFAIYKAGSLSIFKFSYIMASSAAAALFQQMALLGSDAG
jgi:hypothetical protein